MDPLPVPATYAAIESRIADEDEPLPAVQADCTMTLRVPAIDDPVDLPRLIEDLRVQFEKKIRDLAGDTAYVHIGIHAGHENDNRELARDAMHLGGQLWHYRQTMGVSLPNRLSISATTIYVRRRQPNGRV